MYDVDKRTRVQSREDRRLERLARTHPDPADLADHVSNTASETSELFDNEYKPATEWCEDPRPE
jgi:hypothetical protein